MSLEELLQRIGESFKDNSEWTLEFGVLTKSAGGNWQISNVRPITGVRLGEDEILLELGEAPGWLAVTSHKIFAWLKLTNWLQSRQTTTLTAGKLLDQLQLYLAEYSQRPVEACEPTIVLDSGEQARVDYVIEATGTNSNSNTHQFLCLIDNTTENPSPIHDEH